jgi:Zn-dependent protease with chaperone function
MLRLKGYYYPPASARRLPAEVSLARDGMIGLEAGSVSCIAPAAEVNVSRGLGGLPRVFEFLDRGKFECADCPEISEWLDAQRLHRGANIVQRIERRWRWVVGSVVLVVVLLTWTILYGIPASAGWLSRRIPDRARIAVGAQTEVIIMRMVGGPGELEEDIYEEIRQQFATIAGPYSNDNFPLYVKFRSGGMIGPNAFAIPNGTIVITDEMLEMATDMDALLGILAHEVGHLYHRHGTQMAIQASSLPLLITLISGDLGSGSASLGTIPMSLVQNGYSRDHEREADEFALRVLNDNGILTQPLADLFERIMQQYGDVPSWLSTHPATADRVMFFSKQ